jgi:hypothetical protein
MSGTATSDVFSGDPSKKFDVVFSVDMRQLLAGLGMKPAEIDGIMATAVENAKKNLGSPSPSIFAAPPADQAGTPGGMPGAEDNQDQGGGRARGGGGRGGRGGGGMSQSDRQKMQDLIKQAQSSTPAERQKLIEQFTASLTSAPAPTGRGGRGGEGRGGAPSGPGGRQGEGRGSGDGRGSADVGRGGSTGRAGDSTLQDLVKRYSVSQYTEEERNNAKLPLPPEEDSQVQVLLRPGLLADVEIQVEKIPDALHVPAQAVFQRNGKPTVFVQDKNKRFVPREVQLVKQSESMMVLASGVQAGDIVALSDPTAQKSGKKDTGEKKSTGSPMGGMGGGK